MAVLAYMLGCDEDVSKAIWRPLQETGRGGHSWAVIVETLEALTSVLRALGRDTPPAASPPVALELLPPQRAGELLAGPVAAAHPASRAALAVALHSTAGLHLWRPPPPCDPGVTRLLAARPELLAARKTAKRCARLCALAAALPEVRQYLTECSEDELARATMLHGCRYDVLEYLQATGQPWHWNARALLRPWTRARLSAFLKAWPGLRAWRQAELGGGPGEEGEGEGDGPAPAPADAAAAAEGAEPTTQTAQQAEAVGPETAAGAPAKAGRRRKQLSPSHGGGDA